MEYNAMDKRDEYLMLSGLQHFSYCRRQWALIHIEQQWEENERTIDGLLFHKHAHEETLTEKRGNTIITHGLRIHSDRLRISGICDVVEFRKTGKGISLAKYDGYWQPYPIEYKKGKEKQDESDELQLCAQAICLEEMLLCEIPEGSLFYGEIRRRVPVKFTKELRNHVEAMLKEMSELWSKGYTPKVKPNKGCNACSLKEICLPRLHRTKSVEAYIDTHLTGE